MKVEPGYEKLAEILQDALDQAQLGKGKKRHACGKPFEQQEICQGARKCGIGAMVYQARKKSLESLRLYGALGADEAIPDVLGAIVYLAAGVIVMEEQEQDDHTYTDEEPEHRVKCSNMDEPQLLYRHIPVTGDEDEAWESKAREQVLYCWHFDEDNEECDLGCPWAKCNKDCPHFDEVITDDGSWIWKNKENAGGKATDNGDGTVDMSAMKVWFVDPEKEKVSLEMLRKAGIYRVSKLKKK